MKRKINLHNFKTSEVIIAKQDIDWKNIDFKKTAKTWIGKNISSLLNINKDKRIFYKKDQILFISINNNKGFVGHLPTDIYFYNDIFELDGYYLDPIYSGIPTDDFLHQIISIGLKENLLEIVNYNDVKDSNIIKNFEPNLKFRRIRDLLSINIPVYFRDEIEIISIQKLENTNNMLIKGFDILTNKVKEDYIIKFNNILDEKFIRENGIRINGDPFDNEQNKYMYKYNII